MEVNIMLSGNLEIDEDDLTRIQAAGPEELLRALILNGAKIRRQVTEVYQKPAEPINTQETPSRKTKGGR